MPSQLHHTAKDSRLHNTSDGFINGFTILFNGFTIPPDGLTGDYTVYGFTISPSNGFTAQLTQGSIRYH